MASSSSDEEFRNCPGTKFLIVSRMNDKVLDIEGKKKGEDVPVVMYKKKRTGGKNQLWYFNERGYIRSAFSGVTFSAISEGKALKTSKDFSDPMGKWKLDGDQIRNAVGFVLDISEGNDKDGAMVCAYRRHEVVNQNWYLKYT